MKVRLVYSSSRLSGNPLFGAPLPAQRRIASFSTSLVGHVVVMMAITSFVRFDQQYDRHLAQQTRDDRLIEVMLEDPAKITAPRQSGGAGSKQSQIPTAAADQHAGSPGRPQTAASGAEPSRTFRQFQVPELKQVKRSPHQTLLEPALPPEVAVKMDVQLPTEIFLAPPAKISPPLKQFVAPARRQSATPPGQSNRAPVFDTPNFEVKAADIKIADHLWNRTAHLPQPPSTTSPVRTSAFDDTLPQLTASLAQTGDPINLISIPDRPLPPVKGFVVPPGNEISTSTGGAAAGGGAVSTSGAGVSKTGSGASADAGAANRAENGSGGSGRAGLDGTESARGQSGKGAGSELSTGAAGLGNNTAGSARGTSIAENGTAGNGSSGNGAAGLASGAAPGNSSGSSAMTKTPAPGVKTITFPRDGKFEVVIVQSSSQSVPGTAGILTGRPVYTVYVQAGGPKEWIMQYCLPRENQEARTSGGVVQLGSPAPLKAPYPVLIVRPAASLSLQVRYLIVHGFVGASGKFERLSVIGDSDPAREGLLGLLQQWEFRPALKDGQPVAVEVLLVIPKEAA